MAQNRLMSYLTGAYPNAYHATTSNGEAPSGPWKRLPRYFMTSSRGRVAIALAARGVVVERRDGRLEVARVREPRRDADRPEVGHLERLAEVLEHVAAPHAVGRRARVVAAAAAAAVVTLKVAAPEQVHLEEHAARHEAELARRDVERAELGAHAQRARLRQQERVRVRVAQHAPRRGHGRVAAVHARRAPVVLARRAVRRDRQHARDEVGRRARARAGAKRSCVGRRAAAPPRRGAANGGVCRWGAPANGAQRAGECATEGRIRYSHA